MKLKELDCLDMKITPMCCDELSEPADSTTDRIIYFYTFQMLLD